MRTTPWRQIKGRGKSPERIAALDKAVAAELLEMDIQEIRQAAGKTQIELAEALERTQGEISRFENGEDRRISTLQRYIRALGGELEIIAKFGNRRVRLRGI